MLEGALDDPVREPRIARKQRPVEVRADRIPEAHALEAAGAVVSEPGDHAPERHGAGVESGDARVVLEAGQRPPHARVELALEEAVADHPALAGNRLVREEPRAGKLV